MMTLTERYGENWERFIDEYYENYEKWKGKKLVIADRNELKVLLKDFENWLFEKYEDGGIAG